MAQMAPCLNDSYAQRLNDSLFTACMAFWLDGEMYLSLNGTVSELANGSKSKWLTESIIDQWLNGLIAQRHNSLMNPMLNGFRAPWLLGNIAE